MGNGCCGHGQSTVAGDGDSLPLLKAMKAKRPQRLTRRETKALSRELFTQCQLVERQLKVVRSNKEQHIMNTNRAFVTALNTQTIRKRTVLVDRLNQQFYSMNQHQEDIGRTAETERIINLQTAANMLTGRDPVLAERIRLAISAFEETQRRSSQRREATRLRYLREIEARQTWSREDVERVLEQYRQEMVTLREQAQGEYDRLWEMEHRMGQFADGGQQNDTAMTVQEVVQSMDGWQQAQHSVSDSHEVNRTADETLITELSPLDKDSVMQMLSQHLGSSLEALKRSNELHSKTMTTRCAMIIQTCPEFSAEVDTVLKEMSYIRASMERDVKLRHERYVQEIQEGGDVTFEGLQRVRQTQEDIMKKTFQQLDELRIRLLAMMEHKSQCRHVLDDLEELDRQLGEAEDQTSEAGDMSGDDDMHEAEDREREVLERLRRGDLTEEEVARALEDHVEAVERLRERRRDQRDTQTDRLREMLRERCQTHPQLAEAVGDIPEQLDRLENESIQGEELELGSDIVQQFHGGDLNDDEAARLLRDHVINVNKLKDARRNEKEMLKQKLLEKLRDKCQANPELDDLTGDINDKIDALKVKAIQTKEEAARLLKEHLETVESHHKLRQRDRDLHKEKLLEKLRNKQLKDNPELAEDVNDVIEMIDSSKDKINQRQDQLRQEVLDRVAHSDSVTEADVHQLLTSYKKKRKQLNSERESERARLQEKLRQKMKEIRDRKHRDRNDTTPDVDDLSQELNVLYTAEEQELRDLYLLYMQEIRKSGSVNIESTLASYLQDKDKLFKKVLLNLDALLKKQQEVFISRRTIENVVEDLEKLKNLSGREEDTDEEQQDDEAVRVLKEKLADEALTQDQAADLVNEYLENTAKHKEMKRRERERLSERLASAIKQKCAPSASLASDVEDIIKETGFADEEHNQMEESLRNEIIQSVRQSGTVSTEDIRNTLTSYNEKRKQLNAEKKAQKDKFNAKLGNKLLNLRKKKYKFQNTVLPDNSEVAAILKESKQVDRRVRESKQGQRQETDSKLRKKLKQNAIRTKKKPPGNSSVIVAAADVHNDGNQVSLDTVASEQHVPAADDDTRPPSSVSIASVTIDGGVTPTTKSHKSENISAPRDGEASTDPGGAVPYPQPTPSSPVAAPGRSEGTVSTDRERAARDGEASTDPGGAVPYLQPTPSSPVAELAVSTGSEETAPPPAVPDRPGSVMSVSHCADTEKMTPVRV